MPLYMCIQGYGAHAHHAQPSRRMGARCRQRLQRGLVQGSMHTACHKLRYSEAGQHSRTWRAAGAWAGFAVPKRQQLRRARVLRLLPTNYPGRQETPRMPCEGATATTDTLSAHPPSSSCRQTAQTLLVHQTARMPDHLASHFMQRRRQRATTLQVPGQRREYLNEHPGALRLTWLPAGTCGGRTRRG